MTTKAVYAGTFDPPTNGHMDIIERASKLFNEVIVAIGQNSAKKPIMREDTRVVLLRELTKNYPKVEVSSYSGLLVKYCQKIGATVIVRGVRAVTDFDYEMALAGANASQASEIDTICLFTRPENLFTSSSLVRELAKHGGDISSFVHPKVSDALLFALKYPQTQDD